MFNKNDRIDAKLRIWCAIGLLAIFASETQAAALKAGEAQLARGLVSAAGAESNPRLIGTGSIIFEGDVITTSERSAAVLKLADGSRIMLRPNSSFQVEEFRAEEEKPRALMRLFKGGFRAVTGFISKRDPNAMRVRTSVATIGIRGTELDVRLCGDDCVREAKIRPGPSGRIAFSKGNVVAYAAGGRARAIKTGYPLFNGEKIVTDAGAYSVLIFRDGGRATILPNTEFRVDRFEFDESKPAEGRSFFNLVRGGLRVVTGAIGKARKRNYRLSTPVATIGIRGTIFDVVCQGNCVNPSGALDPSGPGLFVEVNDGEVDFNGANPVSAGSTVFMGSQDGTPVSVPSLPTPITEPDPSTVTPPSSPPSEPPSEGLYVSCYVGNCSVQTSENTVELEAGEASFVGGGEAEELPEIPAFQAEDSVYEALESGSSLDAVEELLDGGNVECAVP